MLRHFRSLATTNSLKKSQLKSWIVEWDEKYLKEIGGVDNVNTSSTKRPCISLPENLEKALRTIIKRECEIVSNLQKLQDQAQDLATRLYFRKFPIETTQIRAKAKKIEQKLLTQFNKESSELFHSDHEFNSYLKSKVEDKLKSQVFNWKELDFSGDKTPLIYALARLAPEYAALHAVFNRLSQRLPNWKPESFYDFGSGLCSALWASKSVWQGVIKNFTCFDVSDEMNAFGRLLMKGGHENEHPKILNSVNFVNFLVPSNEIQYDLVVSAYSLLELHNSDMRKQMIASLWQKTKGLLILVERGNHNGFYLIAEARQYILNLIKKSTEGDQTQVGHIASPCPHEFTCPRQWTSYDAADNPCSFSTRFFHMHEFGLKNVSDAHQERFSYVVFQKGPSQETEKYPLMLHDSLKRGNHVHCRLCCPSGEEEHVILYKKVHGKKNPLYRFAKSRVGGDILPIKFEEREREKRN